MKLKALLILGAVLLAGCERPVIHSEQAVEFELLSINPPKHMYVGLKRVVGGQVYESVWVSKRCSRWSELQIGQRFVLTETVYHYQESGRWVTDVDARPVCPR